MTGIPQAKSVSCPGYDHDDLKDGSGAHCTGGLNLFQSVAIDLAVSPPIEVGRITADGILNGASLLGGPVAPGEFVIVRGSAIGPAHVQRAAISSGGRGTYPRAFGGVRVFFDDQPAPLTYVRNDQIGAIVPYAASGKRSLKVRVDYEGIHSNEVSVPVAQAAPGLLTQNNSGRGPGVILNQDGLFNTPSHPARPGTVIKIDGTGDGQTDPLGLDGEAHHVTRPRSVLPVTVRIGGVPAGVRESRAAPGEPGKFRIEAVVPEGAASGEAIPVVITVGGVASQPGVTMSIAGESPRADLALSSYWDVSKGYPDGDYQVDELELRQQGGTLNGSIRDIFASYTSRRGVSEVSGSISGSLVNLSWRAQTPDSDVANVTAATRAVASSDGDALYGDQTSLFDSGGRTVSRWNATRRKHRIPPFDVPGEIRSPRESVYVSFWAPRGAKIAAEVFAEREGSSLDPVLHLLANNLETTLASDDDSIGYDPRIMDHVAGQRAIESQVYHLRVSGLGDTTGPFRLAVAIDITGNSGPWSAKLASLPFSVNGVIDTADEADVYAVDLEPRSRLAAEVRAERAGSSLDPVLKLLAPDGITELASVDDTEGLGRDSQLQFVPSFAGRYFIVVQGYDAGSSGPDYFYTLSLNGVRATANEVSEDRRDLGGAVPVKGAGSTKGIN